MVMIDTSAFIDSAKGNDKAKKAISAEENKGDRICVSSVTVFELAAGNPPGIDERRKKLLSALRVINFNQSHGEMAGSIFTQLESKGLEISAQDCMIAATAIGEGQRLISGNKRHFERIPGLDLVTY